MARSGFAGFPAEGLKFLRDLERNNRREWFQPRKEIFEERLKQPMRELVEAVNQQLREFSPEHVADPDKAIFRIYRDTRFSKDKTPYKTHIAATFRRRSAAAHVDSDYYFSISNKEVAMGGGVYMPPPEVLLELRNRIAAKHEELREILKSPTLKRLFGGLQGEQLTRVPKGFAATHPAADLLRYKSFFVYQALPPEIAATPKLYSEIVARFRAMVPFMKFLSGPAGKRARKVQAEDLF
jgi:uncharacterized protein (TIGR02453 family)